MKQEPNPHGNPDPALPTFVGIGTQRGGTTWAYENLSAHPEVFVSQPKELMYFSKHYDRGQDWYLQHFADRGEAIAWGEITPGYIYRDHAVERIFADLPTTKFILILRNPIERAFSAYKFFSDRYYLGLTFEEAVDKDVDLLEQGLYSGLIKRLRAHVDTSRLLVIFYDDILKDRDRVLESLYNFVGVDASYRPTARERRINASILPRFQLWMRRIGMGRMIEIVRDSPIGPRLRDAIASRNATQATTLAPEQKKQLIEYYREDIEELSAMFDRDLSAWLS